MQGPRKLRQPIPQFCLKPLGMTSSLCTLCFAPGEAYQFDWSQALR
jgi:hypothetical protein